MSPLVLAALRYAGAALIGSFILRRIGLLRLGDGNCDIRQRRIARGRKIYLHHALRGIDGQRVA